MKVSGSVSAILAHKKASTVWSIGPNAMVINGIQLMDEKNVGALPVVDNGTLVHYICDSYSRCYPVFFVRVTPADRRGSL
ncbi:MAG: hypothetical protein JOZ60_00500, partial [Verrucomicrobia bacterium]|nr:hypothetical protein [Verrucomicrobiota bacterium]